MFSKSIQKNKFGGYTWEFKLDSLHHIFINETDNKSFVVDFKEWRLFNYKTHFSFVTQRNLKETIIETFDKIYEYLLKNGKYSFCIEQKNNKLIEILNYIDLYKLDK
jgi:hypothetical protein